jgi:hypothetical protein
MMFASYSGSGYTKHTAELYDDRTGACRTKNTIPYTDDRNSADIDSVEVLK